jgi:hypothetical protein
MKNNQRKIWLPIAIFLVFAIMGCLALCGHRQCFLFV